ncbi:MAG: carbamate kinase [Lachnospiraceae bacterium]|nr:carbamate kinase [Lachnospiraceae bacterium]
MGKKIVVALGRSAFGETFPEQKANVALASKAIADIVEEGYQVVITHSNGQQLGMVHSAMTEFSRLDSRYTAAPLSLCSAMSQGYVGYDLQNAIRTQLLDRGIFRTVSTIITQVKVSPFDKAFGEPSKVIGRVMDAADAAAQERKGNYVTEAPGGFRRIVASPQPIDIYEIDAIRTLSDAGQIVIAAGGGGIPVLEQGTVLKGASAVIEKDLTAGKLAELLAADILLFLTGNEKAARFYGTPQETRLDAITLEEAKAYVCDGSFSEHGMRPKIAASISYLTKKTDGRVVITKMETARDALRKKTGTVITA